MLQADLGDKPHAALSTGSSTANGAVRRWSTLDAFVQEVANARVFGGVHYRFSTEVGGVMGRQIGALAVARHLLNESRAP